MPTPGEFELIRALTAGLPAGRGVIVGPGDDAAVLRPDADRDLVVTTDVFVEGRHWRAGRASAEALGRRLAAANLSDLAAMAARPRWALLAAGVAGEPDAAWMTGVQRAFAAALAADGAAVVGGNLSSTDGAAWWAVTLIGDAPRGATWRRAGARAGDVLAVTGWPGRAAACLALEDAARDVPNELRAWRDAPPSRVRAALAMADAGGVTAAVDVSDGFAADLAHLCEASAVGADVEWARWPDDTLLRQASAAFGREAAACALAWRTAAGDDYELIVAVDPARWDAVAAAAAREGCPLHAVGRFTGEAGTLASVFADGAREPLAPRGWDHFAR